MIKIFKMVPEETFLFGELNISGDEITHEYPYVWVKKYLASRDTKRIWHFKNFEEVTEKLGFENFKDKSIIKGLVEKNDCFLEYYCFYEKTNFIELFFLNIFAKKSYFN
jgi:hypothetical protein